MKPYKIHNRETASPDSRNIYDAITGRRGFVPNVYAVYGDSPHALRGFFELTAAYGASSLTVEEREVVLLTTSVHNKCSYCVAGHSYYSHESGVSAELVNAIRQDLGFSDPKLEALRRFARSLAERRGIGCQRDLALFLDAGYTREQAPEVINGVALKTMSNMTANLFQLPLDAPFRPHAWLPNELQLRHTG